MVIAAGPDEGGEMEGRFWELLWRFGPPPVRDGLAMRRALRDLIEEGRIGDALALAQRFDREREPRW